jgi:hypothetical protein
MLFSQLMKWGEKRGEEGSRQHLCRHHSCCKKSSFVGLTYYQGKDIVFRFIVEYSSLSDFGP